MYTEIAANKRKTWLIIAIFVAIIGMLGWIISNLYAEPSFLYWAIIVGGVYALIQYFLAVQLATAMNGAHEVTKKQQPRLWRVVENLAITTGMPMPKVYVIDDRA